MSIPYIGRFAPSPTGPLHMGSLLAALASFLDARSQQGKWLIRIEDLDPPREQVGATDSILRSLEAHGLLHDGDICFQSQRHERYLEVLEQLLKLNAIFPCQCSRQELAANKGIHNGRCHSDKVELPSPGWAWRAATQAINLQFEDSLKGIQRQALAEEVGDFVLLRKDGLFAYQLAVVVDDIDFNISHIVRGEDLLSSTARQIYLYELLNCTPVKYSHLPLIMNSQGQKLSKQNHAPEIQSSLAPENIYFCLQLLGQKPLAELRGASCEELLQWGIENWNLKDIPASLPRPAS
ncbi:tRNA glutamyl-Q(34) synthetase GluQRS [uncultured Pseudoteredinibacter sp.]|uniref:tRNA glutamyl-Q(34) synthetase GluQRS n=1 Tax=uncultured Pseudoteredinibacter sp. TaxID=1641701 RepID=UPI00263619FC|nr:tRNA glutamyl-Q(34) synthetase GluQRS [uncultured Pseudoteredinibacter sp.]